MYTHAEVDALAARIYEQNVERGWWDDPNRCYYRTLQLVNTEIAEATEGDRKDLMDDHLPHRKMVEVELADTLIRLLDLAGRYEWKFEPGAGLNRLLRADNMGAWFLGLTKDVCDLSQFYPHHKITWLPYSRCVRAVIEICDRKGYDLRGAVEEKLTYNKTRADHNRENRAKPGGKGY